MFKLHLIRQQFHIIKIFNAKFVSHLQLRLKFICEQFLNNQRNLTIIKFVLIFCQYLSILQYLHKNDSSIVHQNIKSSNILIQFKNSNHIHVKFENFDLSKNYDNLSIICDIWYYFISKIYQNKQHVNNDKQKKLIISQLLMFDFLKEWFINCYVCFWITKKNTQLSKLSDAKNSLTNLKTIAKKNFMNQNNSF